MIILKFWDIATKPSFFSLDAVNKNWNKQNTTTCGSE